MKQILRITGCAELGNYPPKRSGDTARGMSAHDQGGEKQRLYRGSYYADGDLAWIEDCMPCSQAEDSSNDERQRKPRREVSSEADEDRCGAHANQELIETP